MEKRIAKCKERAFKKFKETTFNQSSKDIIGRFVDLFYKELEKEANIKKKIRRGRGYEKTI